METFIVQMQNRDGKWFVIVGGECSTLSQARRKAAARRQRNLNSRNPVMHSLPVRIIRRVDTELPL